MEDSNLINKTNKMPTSPAIYSLIKVLFICTNNCFVHKDAMKYHTEQETADVLNKQQNVQLYELRIPVQIIIYLL